MAATRDGVLRLAVTLCTLASAGAVHAVPECDIVCAPPAYVHCTCVDTNPADACTITTPQDDPAPGAVIDCSGMNLVLRDRIRVVDGVVTVRAHDLTVESSHRIEALRTSAAAPFGIVLELTGTLDLTGVLEARSDSGGGTVRVAAVGDIVIGQYVAGGDGILAVATAPGGSGGRIRLESGRDIVVEEPLVADGASLGDTRGGDIVLDAQRDVVVRKRLSAFGHAVRGGLLQLTARTGEIRIEAGSGSFLKAEGGDADGDGGEIYLTAPAISIAAPVSAQGGVGTGGGRSMGGIVQLEAGEGGVSIEADVNVTGGEAGAGLDGGALVVESQGDVTVGDGVHLLTRAEANGGSGGDVRMLALGVLTVEGATIDARGHAGGGGSGASVELEGCSVTLAPGAVVDARGYDGGSVVLTGREALTVSGASTVDTTGIGGEAGPAVLAYRLPGRCSVGPPAGCEADRCRTMGTCTNDPGRFCTTNASCTIGCETGQCIRRCAHDLDTQCTADTDCHPCGSASCVTNPDTENTVAQFVPGPPELLENRNLTPCD